MASLYYSRCLTQRKGERRNDSGLLCLGWEGTVPKLRVGDLTDENKLHLDLIDTISMLGCTLPSTSVCFWVYGVFQSSALELVELLCCTEKQNIWEFMFPRGAVANDWQRGNKKAQLLWTLRWNLHTRAPCGIRLKILSAGLPFSPPPVQLSSLLCPASFNCFPVSPRNFSLRNHLQKNLISVSVSR